MARSAAYINAVVLEDTYSGGVIQPNSRLYFLQDVNWNTTAIAGLVSSSRQVTQRYVYSPYGTISILNASTGEPAGITPAVNNLYQGMALDPVTGLYYARNRNYSPSLGRWINQDPAGYINGANTYQFVMSNPVGNVDPWGTVTFPNNFTSGAGTFRVAMGPAGNGGSPWYTGVDVEFWPSPNARQNYQEILLVQFVRSRYGLEGKTRGWHLDNGAGWKFWGPIPYWGRPKWFQKPPYYVNQAPMQHGPKGLAFAHAWDNPGRNGTNVSEEEWKDYAVGIGYNGSVHSLGYVNYGIDYYDSATDSPTNAITYWIAGGGFSTGTDGQTPGVNAIGIQPSPGGVAP
jgi:RHS repeat-associated protein